MAKLKETKTTYTAEPITVVTARGRTEIPRALRERYRVTAQSRLRWVDTGNGLLVVPIEQPLAPKKHKQLDAEPQPFFKSVRLEKQEFLAWLTEWMNAPDDWTTQQWDEFETELRTHRFKLREVEL